MPPDEEDDGEDVLADLQTLADSEDPADQEEFQEIMESILEFSEGVTFRGPLSEETKKKISEALMKNKGGDLKTRAEQGKQAVSESSAAIRKAREDVANLKSQLANIPKGSKGKAARQKIAAQARKMLNNIKALQKDKGAKVASVKAVQKAIRERKAALKKEISGIRASIKA